MKSEVCGVCGVWSYSVKCRVWSWNCGVESVECDVGSVEC